MRAPARLPYHATRNLVLAALAPAELIPVGHKKTASGDRYFAVIMMLIIGVIVYLPTHIVVVVMDFVMPASGSLKK